MGHPYIWRGSSWGEGDSQKGFFYFEEVRGILKENSREVKGDGRFFGGESQGRRGGKGGGGGGGWPGFIFEGLERERDRHTTKEGGPGEEMRLSRERRGT